MSNPSWASEKLTFTTIYDDDDDLVLNYSRWITVVLDAVSLQSGPVITMPICSSFNDITTDRSLQYFSGWVWYDKEFYVDSAWQQKRVVLRVESAHYNAIVVSSTFKFVWMVELNGWVYDIGTDYLNSLGPQTNENFQNVG